MAAWAERLKPAVAAVGGPVWFLWGTDWEDAPVLNGRALGRALQERVPGAYLDWRATRAAAAPTKGTLLGLFARSGAAPTRKALAAPAPLPSMAATAAWAASFPPPAPACHTGASAEEGAWPRDDGARDTCGIGGDPPPPKRLCLDP